MKRRILYWLCILPACYVEPPNPEPTSSTSSSDGAVDESSGSTDATPS